jgi:transposase
MARPRRIDLGLVTEAQVAVAQASSLSEFRAAQAVLLPALLGASLTQTATLLGVGRATVARLQGRFRRPRSDRGAVRSANWGGRRNALLSREEEEEFLRPWMEQAEQGGILVVAPLRAALAQKLGHPVKPSVVYRLLGRHGWRKVAPDTRHPKSDPAAQEAWKKNSRKRWLPC